MMSDMISSAHQIFSGDQIKENDHEGHVAHQSGGERERQREREIIRVYGGKTWRKELGIPKHR